MAHAIVTSHTCQVIAAHFVVSITAPTHLHRHSENALWTFLRAIANATSGKKEVGMTAVTNFVSMNALSTANVSKVSVNALTTIMEKIAQYLS